MTLFTTVSRPGEQTIGSNMQQINRHGGGED